MSVQIFGEREFRAEGTASVRALRGHPPCAAGGGKFREMVRPAHCEELGFDLE